MLAAFAVLLAAAAQTTEQNDSATAEARRTNRLRLILRFRHPDA